MSFLDFSDYKVNGERGWMVNKEKNVLIYIVNGFELYRAWGAGNCATRIDVRGGYILRNIYVKKDCRKRGLFTEYMDEIYIDFMRDNLGLFLLPCPYEFDICPFEYPEKATVVPDYKADREYLYKKYMDMGFSKIKTGFYNMEKNQLLNTRISGEDRKAKEDEIFAPVATKQNLGYHWLGIAPHSIIPEEVFVESEENRKKK